MNFTFENLIIAFNCFTTKLEGVDHFNLSDRYKNNEFLNYEIELNFQKAEREVRNFLINKLGVKEIYVGSDETGIIKIPTRFASFEAMKVTNLTMINKELSADVADELEKHYKSMMNYVEQHERREVSQTIFDNFLNTLVCLNRVFHEGY